MKEYNKKDFAEGFVDLKENVFIKWAAKDVLESPEGENFMRLVAQIIVRINDKALAPAPVKVLNNAIGTEQDCRVAIAKLADKKGRVWVPLYTEANEIAEKVTSKTVLNMPIRSILEDAYSTERVEGVIINPFAEGLMLDKELLGIILENSGGKDNEK